MERLILVVEDDSSTSWMVAEILKQDGYLVRCAPDGIAAQALLNHGLKPDLVLVDILMPEMDGIEFVDSTKIKAPVVFMTATQQRLGDSQRLIQNGHKILYKPFAVEDLLQTIEGYLPK